MPGDEDFHHCWWWLISRDRGDNVVGLDVAGSDPGAQRSQGLQKKTLKRQRDHATALLPQERMNNLAVWEVEPGLYTAQVIG